jgi:hypothetical protein
MAKSLYNIKNLFFLNSYKILEDYQHDYKYQPISHTYTSIIQLYKNNVLTPKFLLSGFKEYCLL